MKISELTVGQNATLDLILSECSIRKTKTNKDYLQCTLSDGTDTLDGKIWDYNAQQGLPEAKMVYTVAGQVGEYMGKKQITLSSLRISTDQSMSRFSVIYMPDREHLWKLVMGLIGTIQDETLLKITQGFYSDNKYALLDATSAKGVHHVGFGGNLQHSYEVALLADKICSTLNNELMYEEYNVNRDLCIAGALMHDIGKAWVYDQSTPAIDYNELGRWFDHIVIGLRKLDEWCIQQVDEQGYTFDRRKVEALAHIIASHHGAPEKGSPVYPNFMEALIVSQADSISAALNNILQLNRKAERDGKSITDKNWTLGNYPMTLQKNVIPTTGE